MSSKIPERRMKRNYGCEDLKNMTNEQYKLLSVPQDNRTETSKRVDEKVQKVKKKVENGK